MPKLSIFQTLTGAPSRSYTQPSYHPPPSSKAPSETSTSSTKRRSIAFSHSSASTSSLFRRSTKVEDDECSNYSGSAVSVPELWDHVHRKPKLSGPPSVRSEGGMSLSRKESSKRQSLHPPPPLPPPGPVDLGPSLTSLSNDPYAPTYHYRSQRLSSPNILSPSSSPSSSERNRSLPLTPHSLSSSATSSTSTKRKSSKSPFLSPRNSQNYLKLSTCSAQSNDDAASVSDAASYHSETIKSPRLSPSSGSPRTPSIPKLPSRTTNPSVRHAMEVVQEEINESTTSGESTEDEFEDATLTIYPTITNDEEGQSNNACRQSITSLNSEAETFFSALEETDGSSIISAVEVDDIASAATTPMEIEKDLENDGTLNYNKMDFFHPGDQATESEDEDKAYMHFPKRESISSQTTHSYTFASSDNSYVSRVPSTILTTPSPSEFDLKISNRAKRFSSQPSSQQYSMIPVENRELALESTHTAPPTPKRKTRSASNTHTASTTTSTDIVQSSTTTAKRYSKVANKGPAIEIIQSSGNNNYNNTTRATSNPKPSKKPSSSKRLSSAADADPKWQKDVTWLGDHQPKSTSTKKTRQRSNSNKETSSSTRKTKKATKSVPPSLNNISTMPVLSIPSAPPSVLSCPSEKSIASSSPTRKSLSKGKNSTGKQQQHPPLPTPPPAPSSSRGPNFNAPGSISAVSNTDEPFTWPKQSYIRNSNISLPKGNIEQAPKPVVREPTPSPPKASSNSRLRKISTASLPDISSKSKKSSSYSPPKTRNDILSDRTSMSNSYQNQIRTHSILSVPPAATSYVSHSSDLHKPKYVNTFSSDGKSSMVALTISANAAANLYREKGLFGRKRKTSLDNIPSHTRTTNTYSNHSRIAGDNNIVSFNHTSPLPSKVRDNDVVVQVYAAAVDAWDRANVDMLVKNGEGYGSIPGRSFCGKVVETGCNVTKVARGDFVYGLQELEKSGALAEYMSVNRGLVSPAPNGSLTVEQIAALPSAGVAALQAMEMLCADLPTGSKILILNAHEGPGVLAMQLSQLLRPSKDLWVTAHCPPGVSDGDIMFKTNGATEVIENDVLTTLHSLYESSYDAVIDTVGGRRIYDGSRRILHHSGTFVTLVGDEIGIVDRTSQWKNGIRSIRRAFFPKDSKALTYWCPIYDEREDVRDALEKLCDLTDNKGLKPLVKTIYAFDEGGRAFSEGESKNGIVIRIR